eukprot:1971172-Rhodomonas_salina.1
MGQTIWYGHVTEGVRFCRYCTVRNQDTAFLPGFVWTSMAKPAEWGWNVGLYTRTNTSAVPPTTPGPEDTDTIASPYHQGQS